MRNWIRFIPFLFLATIVFFFYLLCLLIGSIDFFQALLSKVGFSVGGRALSFALCKWGCSGSGGLTFAILLAVRTLITAEAESIKTMMAPSGAGASGSGSGEGAGGRGFRWTALFGDLFGSSSPPNSEASANQPAPDSPNPGEPAAPPIAEVYHPLLEDGQRRRELGDYLRYKTITHPLPEDILESIIETQFETELKIEEALRSDRVQEDSIIEKRHQIRWALFYPKGEVLSLHTYAKHLKVMKKHGTHRSQPYQKVWDELNKGNLFLDVQGIKKRRDW